MYASTSYGGVRHAPFQAEAYGSFPGPQDAAAKACEFLRGPRRRINALPVVFAIFGPWLLFAFIYGIMSFSMHYEQPSLVFFIVNLGFVVVIGVGLAAVSGWRKRAARDSQYEPSWLAFMFLTMLVGWTVAVVAGDINYYGNMKPFYDLMNLNNYPDVDPVVTRGQMVMDAGRIGFTADTHLDLTRSIGFKSNAVYCVAPVSKLNRTSGAMQTLSNYDFWAIGVDCCSGHEPDFHCGQYSSGRARGGMRLMHDNERPFYRLAVEQAEATYSIKATHPLFFHWMEDPQAEVNSHREQGFRTYLIGILVYLSIQVFLVAAATLVFARWGYM